MKLLSKKFEIMNLKSESKNIKEINSRKKSIAISLNEAKSTIYNGLKAMAIVLSLIVVMKLIAVSTEVKPIFSLNINDLMISFWGFLIVSFIGFSKIFK